MTEEVLGIDLVDWMLRLARRATRRCLDDRSSRRPATRRGPRLRRGPGRAPPAPDCSPSVALPAATLRVDGWIEAGTEVTPHYDPLLAKVIATGATRDEARTRLRDGLREARVARHRAPTSGCCGPRCATAASRRRAHTTGTLATISDAEPRIVVERAGTMTTVQDWPGRTGMWHVGVPPCGPMDDLASGSATAPSATRRAPPAWSARCRDRRCGSPRPPTVCLTGADTRGHARRRGGPAVRAARGPRRGAAGRRHRHRARPAHLRARRRRHRRARPTSAARRPSRSAGSAATAAARCAPATSWLPARLPRDGGVAVDPVDRPLLQARWTVGVTRGPARRPRVLHPRDIDALVRAPTGRSTSTPRAPASASSARGPPGPRADGGEAGLHPSNIHDTPYAVGCRRLHRRHPDRARPRRAEPRRLRLPGGRRDRRALEARAAPPGRHGARIGARGDARRDARRCWRRGDDGVLAATRRRSVTYRRARRRQPARRVRRR